MTGCQPHSLISWTNIQPFTQVVWLNGWILVYELSCCSPAAVIIVYISIKSK